MGTKASLSHGLWEFTEKAGDRFDRGTLEIIRHRLDVAFVLAKGKHVLEVGPGAGLGLATMVENSLTYTAVEYSEQNYKALVERNIGGAKIHFGDIHEFSFGDLKFDCIIALAMIYYLRFDDFIAKASSLLVQGGQIFFCTSNKDVPGFCPAPHTIEYLSVPEITSRLEKAGFRVEVFGHFESGRATILGRALMEVKKALKPLVMRSQRGSKLWEGIRKRSLGKREALPLELRPRKLSLSDLNKIDEMQIDCCHSVIYVIGTKVRC